METAGVRVGGSVVNRTGEGPESSAIFATDL